MRVIVAVLVVGVLIIAVAAGIVVSLTRQGQQDVRPGETGDRKDKVTEVIAVEIEIPNPVTMIGCGPDGSMTIKHGTPGQPGYTKEVYKP